MTDDEKLIADVKAAMTAAGFTHLTTSGDATGTTVSGDRGHAGAVFHVTSQKQTKAALRRTTGGGPNEDAAATDVAVTPNIVGLHTLLTTDTAAAAALLRISPEMVRQVIAIQPKS
jgi:hypothetical protein